MSQRLGLNTQTPTTRHTGEERPARASARTPGRIASYPTRERARGGCQAGGGGRRLAGARQLGPASCLEQLRLDERALDVRCPPSSCNVKSLRHRGRAEVSRAQGARRKAFGACLGGANARVRSAGRPVPHVVHDVGTAVPGAVRVCCAGMWQHAAGVETHAGEGQCTPCQRPAQGTPARTLWAACGGGGCLALARRGTTAICVPFGRPANMLQGRADPDRPRSRRKSIAHAFRT